MDNGNATYQLYVGIDVGAETFVAAWLVPGGQPSAPLSSEQSPAGIAALQRRLQATATPPAATLVVLETTGCNGYPAHPLGNWATRRDSRRSDSAVQSEAD